MSKKANVLRYLQLNGSITSREASKFCGTIRLSAYILKLREEGYNIDTIRVQAGTDWYGRYVLKPNES